MIASSKERGWKACLRQCHLFSRSLLLLPVSQFQHILQKGSAPTDIYGCDPLAQLGQYWRGVALQTIVRNVLHSKDPALVTRDATPGVCSNGSRRSQHQAAFDWMCDGRRVECKSSQLNWVASYRAWCVQFHGIKFSLSGVRDAAHFDDLILALHSPWKVHILKHDHCLGVSTYGVRTAAVGHKITVVGKRNQPCWQAALATILAKIHHPVNGRCEFLAEVPISDAQVVSVVDRINASKGRAYMKQVYRDVPLSKLSAGRRALILEEIGLALDRLANSSSIFRSPASDDDLRVDGTRRGHHCASVDWIRDQTRVELKHTQLSWSEAGQRWHCHFTGVKYAQAGIRQEARFDELWLAIYSPFGIHMFVHNGTFGVATAGMRGQATGFDINIYSKRNEPNARVALDIICSKLAGAGCQLLAIVHW
eukprot:gb/GFBE01080033.1/.p1 GENE.gb/GFBE01080033.1/~~gb/GFBE01080033.1/.p1  ORF type:complete len:423 (+),score=22.10 gb/GFBE01080033.1/:1-1269(+)